MTAEQITRLARQTQYSESQIIAYIAAVSGTDDDLAKCIIEADLFDVDIDILGRL